MNDTLIDLIRHGEPRGGRAYRGHGIDDPLSEKGWAQMWNAVDGHHDWDAIVSSPLRRCRDFAEALGERHHLPVEVEHDLREVGFGRWEGLTPEQVEAAYPEEYRAFHADPVHARPAGAEDLKAFIGRVTTTYRAIVERHAGQRILIVSHAGVMRAIIAHVLHAEPVGLYRIKVANAGISRIRHGRLGAVLELHNGRPE